MTEPDLIAESVRQYQCRNCGAYIYPEAAVYLDLFDAHYHRPGRNPMLPCGPLRPLGPRCGASTWITSDEDGPLPRPLELFCKEEAGHRYGHFNGYVHWDQDAAAVAAHIDGQAGAAGPASTGSDQP